MYELTSFINVDLENNNQYDLHLSKIKLNDLLTVSPSFIISDLLIPPAIYAIETTFLSILKNDFSYQNNMDILKLFNNEIYYTPSSYLDKLPVISASIENHLKKDSSLLQNNMDDILDLIIGKSDIKSINMNIWNLIPVLCCLYPNDHVYEGSFDLKENQFFFPLVSMVKHSLYTNVLERTDIVHKTQLAIFTCTSFLRSSNQYSSLDKCYLLAFMGSLLTTIWINYFHIKNASLANLSYQLIIHNLFLFEEKEE